MTLRRIWQGEYHVFLTLLGLKARGFYELLRVANAEAAVVALFGTQQWEEGAAIARSLQETFMLTAPFSRGDIRLVIDSQHNLLPLIKIQVVTIGNLLNVEFSRLYDDFANWQSSFQTCH